MHVLHTAPPPARIIREAINYALANYALSLVIVLFQAEIRHHFNYAELCKIRHFYARLQINDKSHHLFHPVEFKLLQLFAPVNLYLLFKVQSDMIFS